MYYRVLDADLRGERRRAAATPARRRSPQPDPARVVPHRLGGRSHDRLARLLGPDDDWFCWMSFPDPHHPWDPPQSERHRVDWRDVPLPAGLRRGPARSARTSSRTSLDTGEVVHGEVVSNYEAPRLVGPATLTPDQVREVNALNAVEVELIDEAIGRVLAIEAEAGFATHRRRLHDRPR
jgi:hypothetical protein